MSGARETRKAYYALATAHAALGSVTEIAGLYILLAAGTSLLPAKFRITKYKRWMRSVLVLWWVVLLLEWRPTRAGTSSIYFRNEIVD